MFKRHLWPAIQWIYGSILQIWCYLARPFRRRSDSTELPLASPVVPSTPSFIQSQEPNFTLDAMRIFQLNNAAAQTSHLARNQLAIQQMRTAPPNINRIASLSSTDPSPGFSLLTDVVDNLVTSAEADSPSLYSSPPSSPSSSLHTPCIVVSSHMGDTALRKNARPSLEFRPQREPRISEWESISQGEFPLPWHDSPEVYGLAKRRNFQGAPIITNLSRDFLPFPPTRILQGNVTPTDWRTQQNLSRPKSALAAVTDFVRASTNIPPRNVSRETLVVSPESQAAFIQRSPFSAQAESFFMDDHLNCPPEFDIHDLGIYADAGSTLNLQVPRRKRTVVPSQQLCSSFCTTTNNYGKPILAKEFRQECCRTSYSPIVTDIPYKRMRSLSDVSHLTKTDISSATTPSGSLSPVFFVPSSVPSHVQEGSSPGLPIQDCGSDSIEQHIPLVMEADEERTVSSSLSLYASLILPFSLENSISWDTGPDFQHHEVDFGDLDSDVLHSFDHDEPVLGVMALDDNVINVVGVLECDPLQFPVTTSALSNSDHQFGDLPSPETAAKPGDDMVRDDNVTPLSPKECPICFPTAPTAIDESFVAGSTTLSALGIHTYSLGNTDGPCEEKSNAACDLQGASLQQADGVLDAPFVSPGDFSVPPPVSVSKSCVNESQTFSSTMGTSPVNFNVDQNISVQVNNRRARRIGIYGSLFPPVVTPDAQDNLVSNSCLLPSASERRRSSSRRESRHGSVLRPLVLPMRVAIRELRTPPGDRSFERAPDTLLQSNRTSIGFPPSFPLPELPLYSSSSTSTMVASGFSTFEELDAFQKLESISTRSLTRPEHLSTRSAELRKSYPDPDGGDSTHTINWGVAF